MLPARLRRRREPAPAHMLLATYRTAVHIQQHVRFSEHGLASLGLSASRLCQQHYHHHHHCQLPSCRLSRSMTSLASSSHALHRTTTQWPQASSTRRCLAPSTQCTWDTTPNTIPLWASKLPIAMPHHRLRYVRRCMQLDFVGKRRCWASFPARCRDKLTW